MKGDDEKKFPKPKVLPPPWWAPEFMLADLVAMQALAAGEADAEQQKRALRGSLGRGNWEWRTAPAVHTIWAGTQMELLTLRLPRAEDSRAYRL